MDVDRVSGAARRRQQRLRQFVRHERLSFATALAEFSHHTSRGQRMARAKDVKYEVNYEPRLQNPPPSQAADVQHHHTRSLVGLSRDDLRSLAASRFHWRGKPPAAQGGFQILGTPLRRVRRCCSCTSQDPGADCGNCHRFRASGCGADPGPVHSSLEWLTSLCSRSCSSSSSTRT